MQLMRYLSNEPVARMGYWSNGANSLAVYKSHTNDWIYIEDAPLPAPGDDLTQPPTKTPTWNDLRTPTEAEHCSTPCALRSTSSGRPADCGAFAQESGLVVHAPSRRERICRSGSCSASSKT
jgi:hypothetical protein